MASYQWPTRPPRECLRKVRQGVPERSRGATGQMVRAAVRAAAAHAADAGVLLAAPVRGHAARRAEARTGRAPALRRNRHAVVLGSELRLVGEAGVGRGAGTDAGDR